MSHDAELLELVDGLVAEVRGLTTRINQLESTLTAHDLIPGQLSEQRLAVLTTAIAAYLGVKPHIRQIRLVSSRSWAQQGRATIQASHTLARHGH